MAPKKKAAQADKGRVEEEVEEPLQAVVCSLSYTVQAYADTHKAQILADSFETRFSPFTLERPRVRTRPCP